MTGTALRADEIDARLDELFPGARVTRRPAPFATSHVVEEIDAEADGTVTALLLKHVGEHSLVPAARGTKQSPLDCAARELYALRDLLPALEVDSPCLHAYRPAESSRDGWLLIERIDGIELWQAGDSAAWEHAARWLADLHRAGARRMDDEAPLIRCNAAQLATWVARARRLQAGRGAARRARLDWLAARCPQLIAHLVALPATVLHGEFYPSNVIVSGAQIYPIDWEMAARGPGVMDVAALVTGWDDLGRGRILRAYAQAAADGAWWREEAELTAAVDAARILTCMRWLGWAEGWQAPAEHRRDWLAEALAIAEERGL